MGFWFQSNTCVKGLPERARAAYGDTCVLGVILFFSLASVSSLRSCGVLQIPELGRGGLALSLTSLLGVTAWPLCASHRTGNRGTAWLGGVGQQFIHSEEGAVGRRWACSGFSTPEARCRYSSLETSSRLQVGGAEALWALQ